MCLTSLVVRVSNPTDPARFVDQEMLVDSGAVFALESLGFMLDPVRRALRPLPMLV